MRQNGVMKFNDLILLTGLLHICSLTFRLNIGMFQNRLKVFICYCLLTWRENGKRLWICFAHFTRAWRSFSHNTNINQRHLLMVRATNWPRANERPWNKRLEWISKTVKLKQLRRPSRGRVGGRGDLGMEQKRNHQGNLEFSTMPKGIQSLQSNQLLMERSTSQAMLVIAGGINYLTHTAPSRP